MYPRRSRPLARLLAGTAVAVLAGVLLAPPAARASCGDYVVMGPGSAAHTPDQHPLPAGPRPCNGPHCSGGQQPLAPPAPAPVPTSPSEQWGVPMPSPLLPDAASAFLAPPRTAARPLDRGSDVYHPPR